MPLKIFKPLLSAAVCLLMMNAAMAQSVAINTDGSVADATALLDVKSTAKGMLVPRMTTAQRTAITTPATGLLVFDTDTNAFWYYNGAGWTKLEVAGNTWSIAGNNGTSSGINFIGTTDDVPLVIKVNNQISGYITSSNPAYLYSTSWGYQALKSNGGGSENTAIGYQALMSLANTDANTAIGYQTLANTINGSNTAVGASALYANTFGVNNSALGVGALGNNTNGVGNTAIGTSTMLSNVSGSNNTAIGFNANVSSATLSNATVIGAGASVNASNKVRIGNSAVTVIEGQVPFTTPSDGRFKYNIREDVKGLDFILQLRPVTYQFDVKRFDAAMQNVVGNDAFVASNAMKTSYDEAAAIRRTGFIAQEVEQAAIKTGYDFSGINKPKSATDHYSLSYESFVVPLVKAVQEQQQVISEMKNRIDQQQQAIIELTKRLEKLEKL